MERPPVTIGGPARPGPEPDLLVGGEELGAVGRRRRKALVALAAVGGLALLVSDEVRERQAADAEQRRPAGVRDAVLAVDLELPAEAARLACGLVPFEDAVSVRYANRQERDEAYEVGLRVRMEVVDCAAAAGGALVADTCSPSLRSWSTRPGRR